MSKSQRWRGKSGATPAKVTRKWALKVQMALSEALRRCMFGGDELELGSPLFGDVLFVFLSDLIVKDLQGDIETLGLKACHN